MVAYSQANATDWQHIADADLLTRVKIAYSARPRITWHHIQVTARSGIVTLRGEVPTAYDRRLVVAITQHVAGVFRVEDQLTIVERCTQKSVLANDAPPAHDSRRHIAKRISWIPLHTLGLRGHGYAYTSLFLLAFATLMFTGCGGSDASRVPVHPVLGTIQFRGQPIAGAFVSLHPKDGQSVQAPNPRATVGTDGNFALTTYDGQDGAPEGEYTLTVQWYRPVRQGDEYIGGPNVLPPKYATARTSDIKINVAAGENRLQPIQLR